MKQLISKSILLSTLLLGINPVMAACGSSSCGTSSCGSTVTQVETDEGVTTIVSTNEDGYTYTQVYQDKPFASSYSNAQQIIKDTTKAVQDTAKVADPVIISSGNFLFSHNDLEIQTTGIPFIVKRFYNSIGNNQGWKFNIINKLDLTDLNNITVLWEDGNSKDTFVKSTTGWSSSYSTDILSENSGLYTIQKVDGTQYTFNSLGDLITIVDKKGLGLSFEYTDTTIVVKDSFSNLIATVTKNSSSQIISITDAIGNTINYAYDGDNITSYTDRNNYTETYIYSGNLLIQILGNDGTPYLTNSYDAQGRVLSQKDGSGNTTRFKYTGDLENYNVSSTTVTYANGVQRIHDFDTLKPIAIEGSGNNVSFTYDNNNKVKTTTDENGKTWTYERNTAGFVTKTIDPQGNSIFSEYDADNNLISTTNASGEKTTFTYDANNNMISTTNALGEKTEFEYNTHNQLIKAKNSLLAEVSYTYNNLGKVATITQSNSAETSYEYDSLGNIVKVTDPLNRSISYEYDKNGKITKITNPLGYTIMMEYNSFGDLIKKTDENGRATLMEYNIDGLLTKVVLSDGNTLESIYNTQGQLISSIDSLGRERTKEYDDFGRVIKSIDAMGNTTTYFYDNVGNLLSITDANSNSISSSYDELYRPSKTIDAYGNIVETTEFDTMSNITNISKITGKTLKFSYDALGRINETTLSGNIKAKAIYDALGHLSRIEDPKKSSTSYEYDKLGNVVKETNALSEQNSYTYDIVNRVVSQTDANGIVTNFEYDALDRITKTIQMKDNIESNITYSYDKVGNLLNIEDSQGKITYTYDVVDRVTSRTDIFGNKVSYEYDIGGRLTKLVYPDGKEVNYSYDLNDNMIQVVDFANRKTTLEYDKNNNLLKVNHFNKAYTLYTYDKNNKLLTLKNYTKDGTLVSANELTRNKIGDIVTNKETNYAAIDLSRIKNFKFETNNFNQIIKSDEGLFSYDKNGNLLDYIYDNTKITLNYDLSDRLQKATIGEVIYKYLYDAEGNRIEVNGKRYVVDNILSLSSPLAEIDNQNKISKYYIWINGLGYSIDSSNKALLYMYDYHGNTNTLLDQDNNVVATYRYSAYGSLISKEGGVETPFKYLGKYGVQTDNTSLYYIRARYYSPELNRWVQADAKRGSVDNPLSLNRYALNEGDIINFIDINGMNRVRTIDKFDSLLDSTTDRTVENISYYCYSKNYDSVDCAASHIKAVGNALAITIVNMIVRAPVSCTSSVMEGGFDGNSVIDCIDTVTTFVPLLKPALKGISKSSKQTIKVLNNQRDYAFKQMKDNRGKLSRTDMLSISKELDYIEKSISLELSNTIGNQVSEANDIYQIGKNSGLIYFNATKGRSN